jgi:hypothetical protein
MANNKIALTCQEREAVAGIWRASGRMNEIERIRAIEIKVGRQLGSSRGWYRLHFGPPSGAITHPPIARPPELVKEENEKRWPYQRRATGAVMHVGMNYLSELVVRPGIRKYLEPLCLYRGAMNPGHAHRFWNYALLMMAAEAETLADGLGLYGNEAFAQLCGPYRAPSKQTLFSFFGRLWDNRDVTDEIAGLTDYVRSLELGSCRLTAIPHVTHEQYCAPWRVSDHPEWDPKAERPESGVRALYYPYLVHNPKKPDDGRDLVLLANKLVPDYWPPWARADLCQELVMAILEGKTTKENAPDYMKAAKAKFFKEQPFLYEQGGLAPRSLDAPLGAEDNRTLHDVVADRFAALPSLDEVAD